MVSKVEEMLPSLAPHAIVEKERSPLGIFHMSFVVPDIYQVNLFLAYYRYEHGTHSTCLHKKWYCLVTVGSP